MADEPFIGKMIIAAVMIAIVGGLMTSTIFENFAPDKYTGMLSIVMNFVPVIFGVGVLGYVIKDMLPSSK